MWKLFEFDDFVEVWCCFVEQFVFVCDCYVVDLIIIGICDCQRFFIVGVDDIGDLDLSFCFFEDFLIYSVCGVFVGFDVIVDQILEFGMCVLGE